MQRWGAKLTKVYFQDLHKGAEHVAGNHKPLVARNDLTGDSGLCLHPVREHDLFHVVINEEQVVIVALLRQGRDVAGILRNQVYRLKQELRSLITS